MKNLVNGINFYQTYYKVISNIYFKKTQEQYWTEACFSLIYAKQKFLIFLPENSNYDIRVKDRENNYYYKYNLNIANGSNITFTWNDKL